MNNEERLRTESFARIGECQLGEIPRIVNKSAFMIPIGFLIVLAVYFALIRFPESLDATIVITASHPPIKIIARSSGKIEKFFVRNGTIVEDGDIIAVIDNGVPIEDLETAKTLVDSVLKLRKLPVPFLSLELDNRLLGGVQKAYNSFRKATGDYWDYYYSRTAKSKEITLRTQKARHQDLLELYEIQLGLMKKDAEISHEQYLRDSLLSIGNLVSPQAVDASYSYYLGKQLSLMSMKSQIHSLCASISEADEALAFLTLQRQEELGKLRVLVEVNAKNLEGEIGGYEFENVFRSPIRGTVALAEFWTSNQYVNSGAHFCDIIPIDSVVIEGRMRVLASGAGKIEIGAPVNIRLHKYPFEQYGIVEGKVSWISSISRDGNYLIGVQVNPDLRTSLNFRVQYEPEMTGTAQIVIRDEPLFVQIKNTVLNFRNEHLVK